MVAKVGANLVRKLVKELRDITEEAKKKPVGEREAEKHVIEKLKKN